MSRKVLQNKSVVAKIGFDKAEAQPSAIVAKVVLRMGRTPESVARDSQIAAVPLG